MARIDGSSRGVLITEESARRISRAIQKLEQGSRSVEGRKFRVGYDEEQPRLGKISASWNKGNTAEVTEINPDGTDRTGAQSFEATNHFANVTVPSGETRKVLCVQVGDLWLLQAAECD
jgi:hypothetical protein